MNGDYNGDYYERGRAASAENVNIFMARVYGWMFLGLLVTAVTSSVFNYQMSTNAAAMRLALNPVFYWGLWIAGFGLVLFLSTKINSISVNTATAIFFLYAVIIGLLFSFIFSLYTAASIGTVFMVSAGVFAFMSVYGYFTKADLTSAGKLLFCALLGIIAATIVNMFLNNSMLDIILCIVGICVFVGLVAYDTQKIKQRFFAEAAVSGEETASKIVIIAALELYLDFINIFIRLLRLFGRRR